LDKHAGVDLEKFCEHVVQNYSKNVEASAEVAFVAVLDGRLCTLAYRKSREARSPLQTNVLCALSLRERICLVGDHDIFRICFFVTL
jgi:hypothetical protein